MQHALSLGDIHSQWHFDRPVILPLLPVAQFAEVKNPIVLQGRGRPLLASNNSTHRDLLDLNWLKMQILGVVVVTVL